MFEFDRNNSERKKVLDGKQNKMAEDEWARFRVNFAKSSNHDYNNVFIPNLSPISEQIFLC